MNKSYSYRLVPEWNAAFKILENCCYDKVIYRGAETGMVTRLDRENELIGILLCGICDPKLKILNLTEAEYQAILIQANKHRGNPPKN